MLNATQNMSMCSDYSEMKVLTKIENSIKFNKFIYLRLKIDFSMETNSMFQNFFINNYLLALIRVLFCSKYLLCSGCVKRKSYKLRQSRSNASNAKMTFYLYNLLYSPHQW